MKTIVLPELKQWQMDVYSDIAEQRNKGGRYVVVAKRQIGKSILAEVLLMKYALEKQCDNIIISPTLNQSRKVFKDICNMLQGSGAIKNANASLLSIDFVNNSNILFKSAEQKESLRGYTVNGILIIDEASYITDDVFEIVFPFCDANNAPMLVISTPLFRSGYFYKLYTSPSSKTYNWSDYDTSEFLSNETLEEYRKTLSSLKFKSEYLGEFIDDGGFVFTNIKNCVSDYSKDNSIYCGIDWASGNGGDYTVVVLMDANKRVTNLHYWNDIEPVEQVKMIAKIINEQPSLKAVTVEYNSIGAVYISHLRNLVSKKSIIRPFTTTNDSKRTIVENLATAFQNGDIEIPNDTEMLKQLQHYAMEKTPSGKITYNGVGANDDICLALAMCYNCYTSQNGNYSVKFQRVKNKPLQHKYN